MINPGVFPGPPFLEDHEAVLRHLRTGVLPVKFAYTGSGAFAHSRFAGSHGYEVTVGSGPLELEAFLARPPAGQLVEIGPGNGRRTAALLGGLARRGHRWHRYLAIDVSATLLRMACAAVREAVPPMAVRGARWDIESGVSRTVENWRSGDNPLTACFLGHTLGNMESAVEALRNIRCSLRPGDRLVAGVTMRPDAEHDVLDAYRSEDFRVSVLQPLLAVGIPAGCIDFHLDYADGVVVGTASLRRGVRLGDVVLPAGHRLRCFRSRRFTDGEVRQLFSSAGWHVECTMFDAGGDHSIVTAIRREGESHAQ